MTISGHTHTELMAIRDTMRDLLSKAMEARDERRDFVDDGPRTVPAWVIYERQRMTFAVNIERRKRDLNVVTLEGVARVEQQAVGHAAYASKFAFYCAELALGVGGRQ